MKEIFSNYFKMSYVVSTIFLLLGILLCVDPNGIISTISIFIGIIILVFGIFEIILYVGTLSHTSLVVGIISFTAGIIFLLNKNILASLIPVIIGIAMVIQGVKKLEISATCKSQNISSWPYMFIAAVVTMIFGIVFIINPMMGAVITTQIIGLLIVIYSFTSIIDNIIFKDKFEKISKIIDEIK